MKAKKDIFAQNEGKIVMIFRGNELVGAQMENGSEPCALEEPSGRAQMAEWKELCRQAQEIARKMRQMEADWADVLPQDGSKAQRTLARFRRLVQKHAAQERTVGFYARRLQLSPHYLSALIKKTSGRTVMQWVNEALIEEAQELLSAGELRTQEVARELNFPDHATFTKFFKRETGLTPQAFRAAQSSSL